MRVIKRIKQIISLLNTNKYKLWNTDRMTQLAAEAYTVFCSIKQKGELFPSLDGMLGPLQVTTNILSGFSDRPLVTINTSG